MNSTRNLEILKTHLTSVVDKYRIICCDRKEIRYAKLFDENDYAYITNSNYKVYVEFEEVKFCIESNDVNHIIDSIDHWVVSHVSLDHFSFFEIDDYSKKYTDRGKEIYNSFNFEEYKKWLDKLSVDVKINGSQSFQYYVVVESIQLIIEDDIINQYLFRSQLLHYDTINTCFLIRDTDIFLNDEMSNTKYSISENCNQFLNNGHFELRLDPTTLSHLISPALIDLRGENILYKNSSISKNSVNKKWLNKNVSIYFEPLMIFDSLGYPCKRICLVENGKIVSFTNNVLASKIFKSDMPSFNPFEDGGFGNYNKIKYYIQAEKRNIHAAMHINKVIDSQAINEDGELKMTSIIEIETLSKKQILSISFYLKDLFDVLCMDDLNYYFDSHIFQKNMINYPE